ncbi:MAG TPA: hypothetical protein VN939_09645 [Chthoniobacterales bacterium]|nr:hypothetical protein [Chthoniobacterales bacterium]
MKSSRFIASITLLKFFLCSLILGVTGCSGNASSIFATAPLSNSPAITKSAKWHVIQISRAAHPRGIAVNNKLTVYFTQQRSTGVKMLKSNGKLKNLGGDLKLPWGVAAFRSQVYVADTGNALVKQILPSGKVKIIGSGWGDPTGVATDPSGNLYVLDPVSQKITRITPEGSSSSVATPEACGESIGGVGVDSQDNMYVSCIGPNQVFKIQPDGSVSGVCSHWKGPFALTSDANGDTFVGNDGGTTIFECTSTGQLVEIKTDTNIGRAIGIAAGEDGNLYVASQKFEIYELVAPH